MSNLKQNASTLNGLLWYEMLKNGSFLSWIVAAWLACIWILCLFNHPGFIIAFGVLFGARAGLRFGGMETVEGSSEFVFALPPTRQQRFLVSLTLGLAGVILLTLVGDLALAFNLPQAFWRIFVSSGFTEPYKKTNTTILHWHAVLIPTAVFAGAFSMASLAKIRTHAVAAQWSGMIVVGAIVGLSHNIEFTYWQCANGFMAIPVLLLFSVLVPFSAYRRFLAKEQISQPQPRNTSWWLVIVIVVVLILFLFLSFVPFYGAD
jgi:hypothetical protein